ncbi:hypothetical protein PMAYCL1PPCAC_02049 [Pristionchus mayeri]|uniref:Uncharacterized protein n=1 Tax=Pristionchus mayeri TaxID=1317129 RepID=A0AAN4Z210_9BILA|nr:hypothetical protein PMAYCL1PPCAC_02049 [Pristionchus mayeri]
MGGQHSKGHQYPTSESASQTQSSMSNTGELTNNDWSDCSVELGEPYDRIEYPPEVYDRVCGRFPAKNPPLAKKKKDESLLSGEQSSAKTFNESEVSPKIRKRKNELNDDDFVPSASSSNKSAKTGKKSDRHSLKRVKKEDVQEKSSSELLTDEDEEFSEANSSHEKKGKKRRCKDLNVEKTREDKMTEKKRSKMESVKMEKEKIESPKTDYGKGEKSHSTKVEKKERRDVDVKKGKGGEYEDKQDTGEKHNSKQEDNKESEKKEQPDKIESLKKKEKESRKKNLESSIAKGSSSGARKSSHAHEVSSNRKESDNGSEVVIPATTQSADVPPPPPRKAIMKKIGSQTNKYSSDDTVLPSCMQQLFKDVPMDVPAAPSASLHSFKVPKKKEASDDRLSKKQSDSPAAVVKPEDRGEGSNGWDPRSLAFVPPQRSFGKPPTKPAMGTVEKKRLSDTQKQQERTTSSAPAVVTPRPSLLGPYPGAKESKYEEWRRTMDGGSNGLSLPSTSLISPNQMIIRRDTSTAVPAMRMDESRTNRSLSSSSVERSEGSSIESTLFSHKSSDGGMRSVTPSAHSLSSSSLFPTPRWTAQREAQHAMVHSPPVWSSFNSTSSAESTKKDSNSSTDLTRKEDNRWNEFTSSIGEEVEEERTQDDGDSPVDTPASPPPSHSSSSRRLFVESQPKPIPIDPSKLARYRLIPIDDECLPAWNRSDRFKSSCAKYRAIAVAGPFPDHVNKKVFEKIMKQRGADVAWTEAPPTNDFITMDVRSIGAILCYSEAVAKEIAAEKMIKVQYSHIPVGIPLEVLVKVEGMTKKLEENELIREMTDEIESNIGPLVELILGPPSEGLVVEGKARFFYSVHGTRAANRAPLFLTGGKSISFSACPPEKSTTWISELISEPTCDEEVLKKLSIPVPRIIPLTPCDEPQPVPPPSLVSLSTRLPLLIPKAEPGTTIATTVSTSAREESTDLHGPSHGTSRFGSLPLTMAIPPPGLIEPPMLRTPKMEVLCGATISIPAISVPAGVIPMPPKQISPPKNMVPILPFPNLPSFDHHFFVAPPLPRRRRSGGSENGLLKTIDPATFIRPFQSLLPRNREEEEEEVLLYARPETKETQEKIDWDAVQAYFKDEDCSSRVYGGIVSLRYTGGKAKEKAQILMLNSPHTVNGQTVSIGLTFPVQYEASKAVSKMKLYEEIMKKFGSVVEVEKKCDSPSGKPVYKVYFDSLETAQTAAREGITVEESTLESIGGVPV